MTSTQILWEYESPFNDYRFRSILLLPTEIKVMLLSASYYNNANIGVNVLGTGHLSQEKGRPPLLPQLVAVSLNHTEEDSSSEKAKLRQEFESLKMTVDSNTGQNFSSFRIQLDDTEPKLRVSLAWISIILTSPTFPVEELEKAHETLKEELLEEFGYEEKRIEFLDRVLANLEHPYSNKCQGFQDPENQTLSGQDLHDAVTQYYDSHYHTSRMYALIQSALSLDELQQLAEDGFAGLVPSGNEEDHPSLNLDENKNKSPYGPEQCGRILKIVPKDESEDDTILLKFHVPFGGFSSQREDYHSIGTYLSNLFDDEECLLTTLKDEKGWIRPESKKSGSIFTADVIYPFDGCLCLQFKMKLTEAGMQNVKGIVGYILAYIRFLEEKGIQSWFWEEIKIQTIYRRRMYNNEVYDNNWIECALDEFTLTGSAEPGAKSVFGTNLVNELDEDLVAKVLGQFVGENARIILVSKSFEEKATQEMLEIKYFEEEISPEDLESWRSIRDGSVNLGIEFSLPTPSPLTPQVVNCSDQESVGNNELNGTMETLQDSELQLSSIWFRQNNGLILPEVYVRIELSSPAVNVDHKSRVLNLMYGFLAYDCCRSLGIRGLYPNIFEVSTGIRIVLDWSSSSITEVVAIMLTKFASFVPEEKEFKTLRYAWLGTEVNILKSDGAYLFGRTGEAILTPLMTPKDKLAAYREITYADMVEYVKKFQERMSLKWLVYGKIAPEVIEMVKNCEKIFTANGTMRAEDAEIVKRQHILIPKDTKWVHTFETETVQASDTSVYFQNAEFDIKSNVLVAFLSHLLHQNLPYWTASTDQLHSPDSRKNLYISHNSSEKGPAHAESEIDNLLLEFQKTLQTMEEKEYVKNRAGFLRRWWNPSHHDNIVEKWFEEISTLQGELCNFSRYKEQAKVLETVGLAEFTTFYEVFVGLVPGKVRRFVLHVGKGPADKVEELVESQNTSKVIPDLNEWVERLPMVSSLIK